MRTWRWAASAARRCGGAVGARENARAPAAEHALATCAAGGHEAVPTHARAWRQSSHSYAGCSWAVGGLGFAVAGLGFVGRVAAEAAEEVVREPRAVPGAVSNEHTAKWRLFTDQGRTLAGKGQYADAAKYMTRALQVTPPHAHWLGHTAGDGGEGEPT